MAVITSIKVALPANVTTNEDLRHRFPDWDLDRLGERTGVMSRHWASDDETALDLGERACRELLDTAPLGRGQVDAILFCTQTPDHPLPPNSCLLHGRLGLSEDVTCFDFDLACSGFVYGLQMGGALIDAGRAANLLLVTADTYSRLINPGDRATRCLFGDGAAATLLQRDGEGQGLHILDVRLATAGKEWRRFAVMAGGARLPRSAETARIETDRSGNLRSLNDVVMDGLGVLSFFSDRVPSHIRHTLAANDFSVDDVDLFVFHQASDIALNSVERVLGVGGDRTVRTLAQVGNLVSASIPHALMTARAEGRIGPGALIVACGFGVGLSWGTALMRAER